LRLAIFGGTFDPIHKAHLAAAAAAVDRALALDPGQAPTARLAAEIASRRRAR
jgi:nicotinic acid mononucleotide adenylyltransferase